MKASMLYTITNGTAFLGVFLFSSGERITRTAPPGASLWFCSGNKQWRHCPNGLPDVLKMHETFKQDFDDEGLRIDDMPEDYGLIVNDMGEATHRAFLWGGVSAMTYLGRMGEDVVSTPATIELMNMGKLPSRM